MKEKEKDLVQIYTDGSCLGNPGKGGWAAILVYGDKELVLKGNSPKTTNNRMELTAVVEALKVLKRPVEVELTTDSAYVVNAINKGWLLGWVLKGSIETRPNSDLWKELLELTKRHKVEFIWVKGHAGHPYNERCDKIAVNMASKAETSRADEEKEPEYKIVDNSLEMEFESEKAALEYVNDHAIRAISIEETEYGVLLKYEKLGYREGSRFANKETKFIVVAEVGNRDMYISASGTTINRADARTFSLEDAEKKAKSLTRKKPGGVEWRVEPL